MKKIILVIALLFIAQVAVAQVERVEKVKYIPEIITIQDKYTFCSIAMERLRLEHNAKGKKYIDKKITKKQWEYYLKEDYGVKEKVLVNDILMLKKAIRESTKYEVNLNDLEK